MAEVILIGVGQCGNQICSKFNEILACEHGTTLYAYNINDIVFTLLILQRVTFFSHSLGCGGCC